MTENNLPAEPSLGGIPAEILAKISRELWLTSQWPSRSDLKSSRSVAQDAWKGLQSLVLSSKKCNEAATPFLYRKVDCIYTPRCSRTEKFIRSVLSNQNLAKLVRHFGFSGCRLEEQHTDIYLTVRTLAVGNGTHAARVWNELEDHTRELLTFESVLLKMENLQELCVTAFWSRQTTACSLFNKMARENQWPRLELYEFDCTFGEDICTLYHTQALLLGTKAKGLNLFPYVNIAPIIVDPISTCYTSLCSIELRFCTLSKAVLHDLLAHCPNLEAFTYTIGSSSEFEEGLWFTSMVSVPEIITLLRRHCKSLNSLHLCVNRQWAYDDRREIGGHVREFETMPSISGWVSLKELRVLRFDLTRTLKGDLKDYAGYDDEFWDLGVDMPGQFLRKLPSSLEVLGISFFTTSILPTLPQILQMVIDGYLPNLRRLEFPEAERQEAELYKIFRGSSLELSFQGYKYYHLR